ncbi:hypothetical protein [Peijinzhouia sedimentorum]
MKNLFLLIFLFYSELSFSQVLSEDDIKMMASRVNSELRDIELENGVSLRRCLSFKRTLIYQYNVPSNWVAGNNLKEELINNLKEAGYAEVYFNNDINIDFYYFYGKSLQKWVSIKSKELATSNSIRKPNPPRLQLGEYLILDGKPKAKGVNIKVKPPIGWKVEEGDRPNVVVKFVDGVNNYIIQIKENLTFFSRNQSKELLSDSEFKKQVIDEYSALINNPLILSDRITTVDNYPSLEIEIKGSVDRFSTLFGFRLKIWIIIYEDKIITLQGFAQNGNSYQALSSFYNSITNSVILTDQYD